MFEFIDKLLGKHVSQGIPDALAILSQCENLFECVHCDCYYPKALYTNDSCPNCNEEGRTKYSPCEHPQKPFHFGCQNAHNIPAVDGSDL